MRTDTRNERMTEFSFFNRPASFLSISLSWPSVYAICSIRMFSWKAKASRQIVTPTERSASDQISSAFFSPCRPLLAFRNNAASAFVSSSKTCSGVPQVLRKALELSPNILEKRRSYSLEKPDPERRTTCRL